MVEILEKFIDMSADFINYIFELKIEFRSGEDLQIGILVLAYVFMVYTIYYLFDAFGLLEEEGE